MKEKEILSLCHALAWALYLECISSIAKQLQIFAYSCTFYLFLIYFKKYKITKLIRILCYAIILTLFMLSILLYSGLDTCR